MAIVYVKQLPGREADWGKGNDRVYRRSFLALTDTRYQFEGQLLADGIAGALIPEPYISVHPSDATYLCKRLRGRQEKNSPLHWIIDAEYDTKPWADDEEETPVLDRRAKFVWSTIKYQKAVEKDRSGEAILNSAGDYFDPPPLKDMSRWTVTVTKNMAAVPLSILSYPDRINSAQFVIDGVTVEMNAAKIMSINISDLQKEGDTEYRVLTYTLEFDENLWVGSYLNQGFYQVAAGPVLPGQTAAKARIKDSDGKDVVTPWLLDENGKKITDPLPSTATFEDYDLYEELNFNGTLPLT